MTRMQARNFVEVVKGYSEGKQLQSRCKDNTQWIDVLGNPTFSDDIDWRLKPESKLVPFDFNTNLIGKTIIENNHTYRQLILDQDIDRVYTRTEAMIYAWLLEGYKFGDGTYCGKKE